MEWFVYIPFAVASGSEHLETVEETAKWFSSEGLSSRIGSAPSFNLAWLSAQAAARDAGWDGTCRGAPLVFWMPGGAGFAHGFAWSQVDATGVLVSPIELPHLGDLRDSTETPSAMKASGAMVLLTPSI
jgi:hypothetical protein